MKNLEPNASLEQITQLILSMVRADAPRGDIDSVIQHSMSVIKVYRSFEKFGIKELFEKYGEKTPEGGGV